MLQFLKCKKLKNKGNFFSFYTFQKLKKKKILAFQLFINIYIYYILIKN